MANMLNLSRISTISFRGTGGCCSSARANSNRPSCNVVLVYNNGSSSVKCQLVNADTKQSLRAFHAEHLGTDKASLTVTDHKKTRQPLGQSVSPGDATLLIAEQLSGSAFSAVGHRVVHGGPYFAEPVLIDQEVRRKINLCANFAPLHNAAALAAMEALEAKFPDKPQVAVFDTAFHQGCWRPLSHP